MTNILKKRNVSYAILLIIMAIQLTRIIYSFAFLKEDYHSDEEWSYGLANSYFEPYIFQDADENHYTHINEWFSADEFRKYLTVQPSERFSYDSVIYNQTKDLHPPLYYIILHTICSFFTDRFSFWYGFSINIAVFIIMQFFLYLLSYEITESRTVPLVICALFGFSSGAMNMFVFVRMYAMLTMFGVITAYLHVKLFKTSEFRKYLPCIFITTLAGSLTNHFFLVYAGTLSACFCFYYLFRKKIKKLIVYSSVLLSSVGLSVLLFPATINHLFGRRGETIKYTMSWQFKISANCVLNELFGLRINLLKTAVPEKMLIVTAVILAIISPLLFLFRKEKWFNKSVTKLINKIKPKKESVSGIIKSLKPMPFFLLTASGASVTATAFTVSMHAMAEYADRYVFIAYPGICIAAVCLIRLILSKAFKSIKVRSVLTVIICTVFILMSNILYPCIYLFENDKSVSIAELCSNSDVIFLSSEHWLITCLSKDLLNSEMIYSTTPETLTANISCLSELENDCPIYLIADEDTATKKDSDSDSYILNNKMSKDQFSKITFTDIELQDIICKSGLSSEIQYVGYDYVLQRKCNIYKIR